MMSDTTRHSTRPSFTALLEGLFADIKALAMQEFSLATHEVQEQLGKARSAVSSLAVAIGMVAVGGLLLILMVVHLLAETGLPLWASYGLVGLAIGGGGVGLLLKAKHQAAEIHVVPIRTLQTMKENLSWIKEEATSSRM